MSVLRSKNILEARLLMPPSPACRPAGRIQGRRNIVAALRQRCLDDSTTAAMAQLTASTPLREKPGCLAPARGLHHVPEMAARTPALPASGLQPPLQPP